jgi:hypothetical protein
MIPSNILDIVMMDSNHAVSDDCPSKNGRYYLFYDVWVCLR